MEYLLSKVFIAAALGLVISVILCAPYDDLLTACAKQHNVYQCELVAVPVKGE